MKKYTFLHLHIVILMFFCVNVYSQILENGGRIPSQYQIDWTNAGLLPEIRTSGLEPVTPNQADHVIIITEGGDYSQKVQSAIDSAAGLSGTSIIFFPGGVHNLNSPIELRYANNHSNIVFQGAGTNETVLQFTVGRDGTCFDIKGSEGSSASINNNINMHDKSFVCSGMTLNIGDWIYFYEDNNPYSSDDVGQITQITDRDLESNLYTIKDEAAKHYYTSNTLKVKKVNPIVNIGIEKLTVKRMDSSKSSDDLYGYGNNIKVDYAVNCWVKGVHSDYTCRHHVTIYRSSHIEVSGSYFHHARSYDRNSYGYGVILGGCSTNGLVENNIFRKLRHAISTVTGANSNVLIYNFSTEQYSKWNGVTYEDSDICLHGRYSFSNLFEHNYVEWIEADTEHGMNGPYNAFFRNMVYRENNITLYNAQCSSVEGCETSNVNINLASMPLILDN